MSVLGSRLPRDILKYKGRGYLGGNQIVRILIELRKLEGRLLRIFLYYALRFQRINPRKVVLDVFNGNGYGDNPKYIAEEILRQNLDYELIWLLRKENMGNHNLPKQIRPVRIDSLRAIYELVTAGVWVDNHLKPGYVKKRKGQFYIQTSHGLPCLKRLEFEDYAELCKVEAKKIDVYLSNSSWTSSVIEKDLLFNGEILECGAPRSDILLASDASVNDRVRAAYQLMPEQKIVLYAPTWRPHYDLSKYTFDVDMCLEALAQRFAGDWVFMVRHHPAVHDRSLGISGNSRIVDASQYEDMQELLAVVDVVVTDYSSLMFDFAIRRLPVFLYTPDIVAYRNERGFYFEDNDLPFSFSISNVQLANDIKEFDENSYVEQIDGFFDSIGTYDHGAASQAVVSRIVAHSVRGRTTSNSYHPVTPLPKV